MLKKENNSNIRIIISGGGTGGHIFPAIAIANALKEKIKDCEILFVGAKGRMEMEKVPAAGYKIIGLWISGLQRKITLKNLLFPIKVFCSILKSRRIINDYKPDLVIGVGGFASGPLLRTAISKSIPSVIQEQNSYPGITNRLLAKKVSKIFVAYDNMEKYFPKEKIIKTGNPIRKDIISINEKIKEEAYKFFDLSENKKTILVIGGSLGAGTINESIIDCLELLKSNSLQIIWQTGKQFFLVAKNKADESEYKGIKVVDFINNMNYAYSVADLIVSRAGAIAISELCVIGKPVILVPSPNVAEDHQTKNAKAISDKNAAIFIPDKDCKNLLVKKIIEVINDDELQNTLSKNISAFAITDAAERIAETGLSLIKK